MFLQSPSRVLRSPPVASILRLVTVYGSQTYCCQQKFAVINNVLPEKRRSCCREERRIQRWVPAMYDRITVCSQCLLQKSSLCRLSLLISSRRY
ncbi:hypothetical protein HDN1F_03150 [gamma proteobacterium HdN1]|nr:hypothetical protein HDN1F_03150 [gamma proteobacterium HdN1]